MNSIREHYNKYPYPTYNSFTNYQVFNLVGYENLTILVIGCGTTEANIVANQNPKSHIIGIDLSESSIKISKSIRRKYHQKNLSLLVGDFNKMKTDFKFDAIIASGVIHHNKYRKRFVNKIHKFLKPTGIFFGMVYSKRRPPIIKELNYFFINNNFPVEKIKQYLIDTKNFFYEQHNKYYTEIADTWLNPYFVEYNEKECRKLLSNFSEVFVDDHNLYKILFAARK